MLSDIMHVADRMRKRAADSKNGFGHALELLGPRMAIRTRRWLAGNPVRFPLSHQILSSVPVEFPLWSWREASGTGSGRFVDASACVAATHDRQRPLDLGMRVGLAGRGSMGYAASTVPENGQSRLSESPDAMVVTGPTSRNTTSNPNDCEPRRDVTTDIQARPGSPTCVVR